MHIRALAFVMIDDNPPNIILLLFTYNNNHLGLGAWDVGDFRYVVAGVVLVQGYL